MFVDARVEDYQSIVANVAINIEVHILNSEEDGIAQMAKILRGRQNLDSIQIISHGSSGSLSLGSTVLNDDNLAHHKNTLENIGASLSESGDILLYGCNVAKGDQGLHFINKLAEYTHADIAASDDLTGSEVLGGDWVLEKSTGLVETLKMSAPLRYQATLALKEGTWKDDVYIISKEDGRDEINNYNSANNVDTVKFVDMIPSDIKSIYHDPENSISLVINYGANSQLKVNNYFGGNNFEIDQFEFSDGTVWKKLDINKEIIEKFPIESRALYGTSLWDQIGKAKELTYSFTQSATGGEVGFKQYTGAQQSAVKLALSRYSDISGLSFKEVHDSNSVDLRFFRDDLTSAGRNANVAGYAYSPAHGDVHIRESYTDFSVGTKGFNILLHEIGHALGLKHSFKSLNENPAVLFGSQDTNQYTVMSYNAYEGVGKSYTNIEGTNKYSVSFLNLTTPMLYDVQAIQYLYGKNITLSNNDIYRFSTDTTEFKTIWDAGGNDTFDLSDHSVDAAINLTAGRFSSIGDARYFDNGIKLKPAINNIAIAYGVEIENAIGGKGNDFIIGNDLENKLTGGSGNDLLDGGKGNDTAIYKGNLTDYKIEKRNSGLKITSNSANNEGIDSLRNIEKLQFSDQTVDAITLSAITDQLNTAESVSGFETSRSASALNPALKETLIKDIRSLFTGKSDNAVKYAESFIDNLPNLPLKIAHEDITFPQKIANDFVVDGSNQDGVKVFTIDTKALFKTKELELKEVAFAVIKGDTTVKADSEDNVLFFDGSNVKQKIFTAAGNDTTELEAGKHLLNGGEGVDKLKLSGAMDDYKLVQEFAKITLTNKINPNDVKTLVNLEAIEFSDQTITIEYDAAINAVAGTYTQILGRQAATVGIKFWTDGIANKGLSLGGMALAIMTSKEQQQKLGFDITQADANTQVEQFYKSFLHRDSETEGQAFWEKNLSDGTLNLEDLATSIIQTPEMESHYLSPAQWDFLN